MGIEIVIFICAGILIGFCSGIFGGGSGFFGVPILLLIFEHYIVLPEPIRMHFAIGSTIAVSTICFEGALDSELKNITFQPPRRIFWLLNIAGILSVIPAVYLAAHFSTKNLTLVFALMLFVAVALLYLHNLSDKTKAWLNRSDVFFGLSGFTSMMGTLTGIGAGAFILPLLKLMGMNLQQGVSTLIRAGAFVLPFMSLGYILLGIAHGYHTRYQWGYVEIIPTAIIGVMSLGGSMLAVKLRARLPEKMLKYLFSLLLVGLGIYMLMRAF